MAEVAAFIEFRLRGLRHANAHHSFEDLCRQVARHRLVSNVLPATGPVAGGGDQGRDFETFPTEATGHENESSRFYALAAKEPTAFACTVQASGLKQKIKDDVTAICSHGTPRRAYFFCAKAFKVSACRPAMGGRRVRDQTASTTESRYDRRRRVVQGLT